MPSSHGVGVRSCSGVVRCIFACNLPWSSSPTTGTDGPLPNLHFEVDATNTRLKLSSDAEDVISHIQMEEPITCFITRQLPVYELQKELQQVSPFPGWLHSLQPRVL